MLLIVYGLMPLFVRYPRAEGLRRLQLCVAAGSIPNQEPRVSKAEGGEAGNAHPSTSL